MPPLCRTPPPSSRHGAGTPPPPSAPECCCSSLSNPRTRVPTVAAVARAMGSGQRLEAQVLDDDHRRLRDGRNPPAPRATLAALQDVHGEYPLHQLRPRVAIARPLGTRRLSTCPTVVPCAPRHDLTAPARTGRQRHPLIGRDTSTGASEAGEPAQPSAR